MKQLNRTGILTILLSANSFAGGVGILRNVTAPIVMQASSVMLEELNSSHNTMPTARASFLAKNAKFSVTNSAGAGKA